MPNHPTSMQAQSPLSEAQDSVQKAQNAVSQALSHPSEQMVQQAENALEKAENAVSQAQSNENTFAVDALNEDFAGARSGLQDAQEASSRTDF